jgi:MFS family permease
VTATPIRERWLVLASVLARVAMNSYARVLRHHNFRCLFIGQAASVIGDQVVIVALALFVTQRTGSPTDLGLVLGAQSLTLVTLLLVGGVWADRLPRQRIMIVADLARGLLQALLAILILTGIVEVWQMVVVAAAYGGFQAFFEPAYAGLVPQTIPEDLIQDAKALTNRVGVERGGPGWARGRHGAAARDRGRRSVRARRAHLRPQCPIAPTRAPAAAR